MDANDNNDHVHILEEYCASDDISLDGLRDRLNQISQPTALACSHFLHELCLNESVTHDMVQLVLDKILHAAHYVSNRYHGMSYDDEDVDRYEEDQNIVADTSTSSANLHSNRSYPVHLAASNVHCPNSVVELLAKNNPSALGHLSNLNAELFLFDNYDDNYIEGTPLHYYLSRTLNLQLNTVKILVELCPESLKLSGPEDLYPIDAIIDNPEVGSYCDIVQYLVDTDPTILQCKDYFEQTPLHSICRSKNVTVTVDLVQVLVDGYQDATKESDLQGSLPIHHLCMNEVMENGVKLDVLRILIDAYPESLHTRSRLQDLPIHIACRYQGPTFCKMLVDSYPDSLRVEDSIGCLPFHHACETRSLETVQYLYETDRECINKSTRSGFYPIHAAIGSQNDDQYEITKFLLKVDPDCAAIALPTGSGYAGYLPMHLAVVRFALLEAVKLLFDAYPAAIYAKEASSRGGVTPVNLINVRNTTVDFLQRQENDISRFRKNDTAFPLHQAVQNNVTLGVFKFLVERYPWRVQLERDNEGKTTLHLACKYGNIGIMQYLIQDSNDAISVSDADGNYPLHLACREGYCEVVNYLLEVKPVSVSTQNGDKKLPIELLIESDCDQDSLVYTEAIWRLLVASPPTF